MDVLYYFIVYNKFNVVATTGQFSGGTMMLVAIAMFMSVVVTNIYAKKDSSDHVPRLRGGVSLLCRTIRRESPMRPVVALSKGRSETEWKNCRKLTERGPNQSQRAKKSGHWLQSSLIDSASGFTSLKT